MTSRSYHQIRNWTFTIDKNISNIWFLNFMLKSFSKGYRPIIRIWVIIKTPYFIVKISVIVAASEIHATQFWGWFYEMPVLPSPILSDSVIANSYWKIKYYIGKYIVLLPQRPYVSILCFNMYNKRIKGNKKKWFILLLSLFWNVFQWYNETLLVWYTDVEVLIRYIHTMSFISSSWGFLHGELLIITL